MNTRKNRCETCKYMVSEYEEYKTCRRFPSVVGVSLTYWCGEFVPNAQRKLEIYNEIAIAPEGMEDPNVPKKDSFLKRLWKK